MEGIGCYYIPYIDTWNDRYAIKYRGTSPCSCPHLGFHESSAFWSLSPLQNFSLLRQGYIGTSPVNPKLAICLRSIDDFMALRRQCPGLSVERFTKALCAKSGVCTCCSLIHFLILFQIRYTPTLWKQVSRAVDYFMEMEKRIDWLVGSHLQCNMLELRLKSACPACHHKVCGISI